MNIRIRLAVDEMARHRAQFEYLCRSLDAAELKAVIPGSHWTVKDYIAHLATIDALIAHRFGQMVGKTFPAPDTAYPEPFDIDEWNESAVRTRADRSIDDLLAEAARHRENMVAAFSAFEDNLLDLVMPYGGDRKALGPLPQSQVRLGGLLWAIAIHDPTHTQDIVQALPERAKQPWLSEWLASVNDSNVPEGVKEQRV